MFPSRIKNKDGEAYNDEIKPNLEDDELETFLSTRGYLNKTTIKEEIHEVTRFIQDLQHSLNMFIPEEFFDLIEVLENPFLQAEDRYQIYDTDKKPGLVLLFSMESVLGRLKKPIYIPYIYFSELVL